MKNQDRSFTKNGFATAEDKFYPNAPITWSNWSKAFPFKLIMGVFNPETGSISKYQSINSDIVLPIPPQSLKISMPIASSLAPTLEGVVEQSNGSPFRDITLQGVTGVNLIKNSANPNPPNPLAVYGGALFPTATQGFLNIQNSALTISGGSRFTHSAVNSDKDIVQEGTGFYQFHAIRAFIEKYVELKRKNIKINSIDTKNLRLIFANYKDEAFYVCSAVNFTWDRNANDPLMYTYFLQLKAYRRISSIDPIEADSILGGLDRNYSTILNKALTVISAGVDLLDAANQGVMGLVGDATNDLTNISKKLILTLKKANNVAVTIADLPISIRNSVIQASASTLNADKLFSGLNSSWVNLNTSYTSGTPASVLQAGGTGSATQRRSVKDKPEAKKARMLNATLSDFALPAGVVANLNTYIKKSSDPSISELEASRTNLQNAAYEFANSRGASSPEYAIIYSKNHNGTQADLSLPDAKLLFALNRMIQTFDVLAAQKLGESQSLPSTLQYVAGLAAQSGIAFTMPISKFAVPFPYGATLERLSQRYLGAANRWMEIAALNGLQAPYVDEEGWSYALVSNGTGSLVYTNTRQYLHLGQFVYLVSNTINREKRKVLAIRDISDTLFEVTLDGSPDLSRFTTAGVAKLEGFRPNTVNSQQVIYIPSSTPAPDLGVFIDIPSVNMYDPLIQAAGVDLLLDETGDFILTEDGDTKLAYGLQNIIQGVNIAFSTERGQVLQHPLFGAGVRAGTPTGDIRVTEISNAAKSIFSDSNLFSGVSSIKVVKDGPALKLTVIVGLKALGTNLPLTFIIG